MKKEEKVLNEEAKTPWKPTYKWFAITGGSILAALIITFFVLNVLLKPYMREIPPEITPWLKTSVKK